MSKARDLPLTEALRIINADRNHDGSKVKPNDDITHKV